VDKNSITSKNKAFLEVLYNLQYFFKGSIDYLLGKTGAILTYPVSFIGNYLVFNTWEKSSVLRTIDFIFTEI
jgi:hypothetical protein